jgi:hypothetical protein
VHCEFPEPPEIVLGLQVAVIPEEGVVDVVRVTVPVNPPLPEIVVVKVPVPPEGKDRLVGFTEMLKSCWPESLQAVTGWISQPL